MGHYVTDFLYARPSFLEGMGRILDFGNTMTDYNLSETGADADERALMMDWAVIGQDLRAVIRKGEEELQTRVVDGEA